MRAGAARTRIPRMRAVDLQADEARRPICRLQTDALRGRAIVCD